MKPTRLDREDSYSVRAVDRALDILDVLQQFPAGASITEVAKATRLPKSSAFRYLATLEARGYVDRDPSSRDYRVGLRLPLRPHYVDLLPALVRPYLEELRDRFEETTNLGLVEGNRVIYLEIAESRRAIRFAARKGDHDPIHSTALGKAIAAELIENDVRKILVAEGMPQLTSRTITDSEEFLKGLEQVRRRGFALDNGENEEDCFCVAVAISAKRVPAAISLSAPTTRCSAERVEEVAAALIRTAGQLALKFERANV